MRLLPGLRTSTNAGSFILLLCAGAEQQPPGLQFFDVPRDGDCLFSAVALSAALTDDRPDQARARAVRSAAARLRQQALELLCPTGIPDAELILGDLPASLLIEPLGGESEATYCQRMRQPGEWGSTAELLALTRVLARPIKVYTSFGAETYGSEEAGARSLAIHFESSHYRAVTEPEEPMPEEPAPAACAVSEDESTIASLLDSLHAAAAAADGDRYFGFFAEDAVFMGTDASERWPLPVFREYAGARFNSLVEAITRAAHVQV